METKPEKELEICWGPCCFCGGEIEPNDNDPCSVSVETANKKLQVWFAHTACFKQLIAADSNMDLSPAHF